MPWISKKEIPRIVFLFLAVLSGMAIILFDTHTPFYNWTFHGPIGRVLLAQSIELACPAGTSSFQEFQTFNPSTGRLRQNLCIDANGTMTFQGSSASVFGPVFNIKDSIFGAKGDAQIVKDGVTPGGAGKTVTSATASFCNGTSIPCTPGKTSDVNKFIACVNTSGTIVGVGTRILTVVSATQVTTDTNDFGAANTLRCIWYTKKDDAAIRAAILAATPPAASNFPNVAPTLGHSGTVYCPEGGYAVTVNSSLGALMVFAGTGSSIPPNFIGEGKGKCNIYVLPDSTDAGGPQIFNLFSATDALMGGFTIDGLTFPFTWTHAILGWTSVQHSRMYDIGITNIGANVSNRGTLDFTNSADVMAENVFVQGGSNGANDFACGFSGVSSSHFKNLTCSNHNQTAFFFGSGALRGVSGDNGPVFENVTFDECGSATLDCTIFQGGYANFFGGWIGVGNTGRNAINVDATSRVWLSNVNCGQFGSTNVVTNCMTIASGGEVNVTMSDLRGNGSGANGNVVNGPAGAKFFDMGGNKYRNCVSAVCTDVSLANWNTLGFVGGVTPVFPLAINATTQLGGRQVVAGNAPTFSVTGFGGAGLTVTVQTGSTDAAGTVLITAGAAPAANGTFTLTFTTTNGAYGTNPPVCIFGLSNGTGSWNALAQEPIVTSSATTAISANWADNGIALTAASTYGFIWSCYGK